MIPSFPWIAPGWRKGAQSNPDTIEGKEVIKLCSAAYRSHSTSSPKGQTHTISKSGYRHLVTMIGLLLLIEERKASVDTIAARSFRVYAMDVNVAIEWTTKNERTNRRKNERRCDLDASSASIDTASLSQFHVSQI